jgi:hypothetical protein
MWRQERVSKPTSPICQSAAALSYTIEFGIAKFSGHLQDARILSILRGPSFRLPSPGMENNKDRAWRRSDLPIRNPPTPSRAGARKSRFFQYPSLIRNRRSERRCPGDANSPCCNATEVREEGPQHEDEVFWLGIRFRAHLPALRPRWTLGRGRRKRGSRLSCVGG